MIQSVSVTNHIHETLKLVLSAPEETGVTIKDISGLGPQKAVVNISEFANMDGGVYSSARLPSRSITFNFALQEKPTVEDVRLKLYRYFPIKKPVILEFETTIRTYTITGIVSANEPNIFQKEETVQIVVECEDPYFYDNNNNNVWMYKNEPLFTFPFSNESLTENLIEFSRINPEEKGTIDNPGMDDAGGLFRLYFNGPVVNPTIVNVTTNEQFFFQSDVVTELYGQDFKEGDQIEICTITGKRYVELYRDGLTYNILNAVRRDSKWLQFVRGENTIFAFADSGEENLVIEAQIVIKYEGI